MLNRGSGEALVGLYEWFVQYPTQGGLLGFVLVAVNIAPKIILSHPSKLSLSFSIESISVNETFAEQALIINNISKISERI